MARAARRAGRRRSSPGDTKVVERGKADGLYVTTAGVGVVRGRRRARAGARPARRPRARLRHARRSRHGRDGRPRRPRSSRPTSRATPRRCTSSPPALLELGAALRWMRDPTRGGLATALNELAVAGRPRDRASTRPRCPLRPAVVGACEILGIDPLYVANEGKLVAVVAPDRADDALAALRRTRWAPRRRSSARCAPSPRTGAARHRSRRQPHRRHARRRPAPRIC